MTEPVLFSRASDEWTTPRDLYDALDAEFGFTLDAAATTKNTCSPTCLTRAENALLSRWGLVPSHRAGPPVIWLNPPYSKAAVYPESAGGSGKWLHRRVSRAQSHRHPLVP